MEWLKFASAEEIVNAHIGVYLKKHSQKAKTPADLDSWIRDLPIGRFIFPAIGVYDSSSNKKCSVCLFC